VAHADGVGGEAGIGGPFGLAEALAKNGIQAVVAAADQYIAVGGWKGFVWHDGGCGISSGCACEDMINTYDERYPTFQYLAFR